MSPLSLASRWRPLKAKDAGPQWRIYTTAVAQTEYMCIVAYLEGSSNGVNCPNVCKRHLHGHKLHRARVSNVWAAIYMRPRTAVVHSPLIKGGRTQMDRHGQRLGSAGDAGLGAI